MSFFNWLFNSPTKKTDVPLEKDRTLSEDVISNKEKNRKRQLEKVIFHYENCLKKTFDMEKIYETLKGNFPLIIASSEITSQRFKAYVKLLFPEMDKRGDWQEGIEFLRTAVETRLSDWDKVLAYIWLSKFHGSVADYESAIGFAKKAVDLAEELEDNKYLTEAYINLARIYRSQGQYQQAIDFYDISIEIAKRNNIKNDEAHAHSSKGLTYWHMNEYENSLISSQIAQKMFIKLNNEERTGHTFNNIGIVYTDLGLYKEAMDSLGKALEFARKNQDKKQIALTEGNIAMVHFFNKEFETSLKLLKETMQTMSGLGSFYRLAKAKMQIAGIYQEQTGDANNLNFALEYAKESYEIGLRFDIVHFQITGASYQAVILKDLNRNAEAFGLSKKAVDLLEKVKLIDGLEEEVYFNHYLILKDSNDVSAARNYLEKSKNELEIKLEKITNIFYRESFLNIELNKQIRMEIAE